MLCYKGRICLLNGSSFELKDLLERGYLSIGLLLSYLFIKFSTNIIKNFIMIKRIKIVNLKYHLKTKNFQ